MMMRDLARNLLIFLADDAPTLCLCLLCIEAAIRLRVLSISTCKCYADPA
jgi:hypothetical protein